MYYRLVRNDSTKTGAVQTWNLELPATIGRSSESTVCIDDESISRVHCKIFLSFDEALMVRDQGSTNGTYVNGERVQQQHSLSPGDSLQVGSVTFQVLYASDTDPGPATPKKPKPSQIATQPMRTISVESIAANQEASKRWWEFWKS